MHPRENKNVTQITIEEGRKNRLINLLRLISMTSPYQEAWKAYQLTSDYASAVKAMTEKGMQQPYINNILELAFMAGRNSK